MKVVLFCGGLGTRLREHTETIPKPMVNIGHRPIIWHLMRYYARFGHSEFILCLGYKGDMVKEVSDALFKEWENELEQYTSPRLRNSSEQKLELTRQRYEKLMAAMERARDKIDPVLNAFKDQVLFLKHNLNARAIASLQEELGVIESEIAVLIREMETSIAEANLFIEQITGEDTVHEREMQ